MRSQRAMTLLAATALLLAGCAGGDSGDAAAARSETATPASQPVTPAQARGVQPCTTLPTHTNPAGERWVELTLPCLTGGPEVELSRLGGRPVLVNLWATWCGPCREEMPILQDAYERYGARVGFVGVNTKDDPHAAASFLEDVAVTYPQLLDADAHLLTHLQLPGLPVTVLLDARGQVSDRHVGPLTTEQLVGLLETQLGRSR